LNYRPSVAAAAAVYSARVHHGRLPFWPTALSALTGYSDASTPELMAAIRGAYRLLRGGAAPAGDGLSKASGAGGSGGVQAPSSPSPPLPPVRGGGRGARRGSGGGGGSRRASGGSSASASASAAPADAAADALSRVALSQPDSPNPAAGSSKAAPAHGTGA
jgi:hypothetical protein